MEDYIKINFSKVGDECLVGDGAHASIERLSEGVLYLTSKNFRRYGLDLTDINFISQQDYEKYFNGKSKALTKPQSQDLILSIIGSTIGVPYLVSDKDSFGVSSSVAIIRPKANVNSAFLFYYLQTSAVQDYIEAIKGGSAQGFLSLEMIRSIPLSFPNLPTQQRIAGILSAYDELIEVNNQRIRLLEETARQLYKEWFVRLRFPGHERTQFIKGLPDGWEVKKLGELTCFISRGLSPVYDEKGISTVLNQRCIRERKIDFEQARKQNKIITTNKLLKKGDVLINSTGEGTLGRTAQLHCDYANLTADSHITIVRAKQPQLFAYLGLTIASLESYFESMAMGATGQTELSRKIIYDVLLKVPTDNVVRLFSTHIAPINEQIETLQSQNTYLRQTRDRLLPRLISGKLSVGAVAGYAGEVSEPNLA